jgi:peptidoglycan/LPS O-acetylase OafA/YrhL
MDTMLLLACAAWLIVNSHMENFYPRSFLAADGLLGASLFYMLSGFGVQWSLLHRSQTFGAYMLRRITRLYPAAIPCMIALLLVEHRFHEMRPLDYVTDFIWPTRFTYIYLIVPFYILFFAVGRSRSHVPTVVSIVLVIAVFSCRYVWSTWHDEAHGRLQMGGWRYANELFCWIVTATGALIARLNVTPRFSVRRAALIVATILGYLLLKLAMVVYGKWIAAWPVLMLLVLVVCCSAMYTCTDPALNQRLRKVPLLGPFLSLSALLTLEIYLVHTVLAESKSLRAIPFPLNLAALAGLTLVLSYALSVATRPLRNS